jgi:hypothetical protein
MGLFVVAAPTSETKPEELRYVLYKDGSYAGSEDELVEAQKEIAYGTADEIWVAHKLE